VIEAAESGEALVQRPLAGVAERRMTEVVRKGQRLAKILIEPEGPGERAGDLGDLKRVSETRAEMVAFVEHEHLGLVRQPPEGGRMDDAVAITPEIVARRARRLLNQPAAAALWIAGVDRPAAHAVNRHNGLGCPQLTRQESALNYR